MKFLNETKVELLLSMYKFLNETKVELLLSMHKVWMAFVNVEINFKTVTRFLTFT